jgi:hypothetical protein
LWRWSKFKKCHWDVYKRPATAKIPPTTAPIAGRAVGAEAAPVLAADEAAPEALEAAELRAEVAEARMADSWEAIEAEALGLAAATELKLASACEAWLATDERAALAELWADAMALEAPDMRELAPEPAAPVAELAAEPAAEVAEPTAEPAADVMEAMAEPGAPTTDESWPARELRMLPWAAAPAARRVVETMEKRILIELVIGWGWWSYLCVDWWGASGWRRAVGTRQWFILIVRTQTASSSASPWVTALQTKARHPGLLTLHRRRPL